MAFVNQKIYHVCVFNCILMSATIFAHYMPSSSSPSQNNRPISFPGGMRTYNSSRTLLGKSHPITFTFTFTCVANEQEWRALRGIYFVETISGNWFRSVFVPRCILIAIGFVILLSRSITAPNIYNKCWTMCRKQSNILYKERQLPG